ncbi:hypothetical protein ACHHYP_06105 [Achlya hypogyna]|uniref:FMP27 C-terminal domain-containing protein n=1 Tax=Achlya hypogyna TaxID=1202772 RepID=A0A1V9YV55_ACHHY|nr:hypothetical protein ACHHYP_06105 [Achlya hypogyna]
MLAWATLAIAAAVGLRLIAEAAINWAVRRSARLLSDIPLDATSRISVQVHPVRLRIWSVVWAFLKAPSQAMLLRVVISAVSVTVRRCPQAYEKSEPFFPSHESLTYVLTLSSPTHPIWATVLPFVRRYGCLTRVVHLVGVMVPDISVSVLENDRHVLSLKGASLQVHAHLNTNTYDLVIRAAVAVDHPLVLETAYLRAEMQELRLQIVTPLSRGPTDPRVPLPCEVALTGQTLHVHITDVVSLAERPAAHSRPALSEADWRQLLRHDWLGLLPRALSLSWTTLRLEAHLGDDVADVTVGQVVVASRGAPRPEAAPSRAVLVDISRVAVAAGAPVLSIASVAISCDVTPRTSGTMELKVSGDVRRVDVRLHDRLEPWVALTSRLVGEAPPPVAFSPWVLDVQIKFAQTRVATVPRALPPDDPSYGAPGLSVVVDDTQLSVFPPSMVGVRSLVELRLSRLGIWADDSVHVASVDSTRLFFRPVGSLLHSTPARVEMEAEWVQATYSAAALQAFGGGFHLALFVAQAPLRALFATPKTPGATAPPSKRTLDTAFATDVYAHVAFHGVIKRIVAIFPVTSAGVATAEHVTVEQMSVETEADSGRYRLVFRHAKAASSQAPAPYLTVAEACIEETPVRDSAVVDLYGRRIAVHWDVALQLRLLVLVQAVTLASYHMLFQLFHAYTTLVAPAHSKFIGGVNPPLDDTAAYARAAARMPSLLSASGDKLHRLAAEQIAVDLPAYDLSVSLARFGGDDLPDLWAFGGVDVQWRRESLLAVAALAVRRTLDKCATTVFGEFGAMLRQRQQQVAPEAAPVPPEGLLLNVEGVELRLPYASLDALAALLAVLQRDTAGLDAALAKELAVYWRPQSALAYRYFLKLAEPRPPLAWLDVRDVAVVSLDHPLEVWLAHMQPVWAADLRAREARRQIVEEQWRGLQLTHADLLAPETFEDMTQVHLEKNATLYVQRVRARSRLVDRPRLRLHIASVTGSVAVGLTDEPSVIRRLQELDEATAAVHAALPDPATCYRPLFDFVLALALEVRVEAVSVALREHAPLHVALVTVAGDTILARPTSTPAWRISVPVPALGLEVQASTSPLKLFLDVAVGVHRPSVALAPELFSTLAELLQDAQHALALVVPPTAYWDTLRAFFHGKCAVRVADASVRLLGPAQEPLLLSAAAAHITYASESISVAATQLRVRIEPLGPGYVLDVPHVRCAVRLDWASSSGVHYEVPRVFTFLDGRRQVQRCVLAPVPGAFASTALRLGVTASVVASDKHEVPSVLLYGKSIEWLLRCARLYAGGPPSATRRRGPAVALRAIVDHVQACRVDAVDVAGVDVALYYSDLSPEGCRLSLRGLFLSLGATRGLVKTLVETLDDHMLSVVRDVALHDVVVGLEQLQCRVCTPRTGSRGEALVDLGPLYVDMDTTRAAPPIPAADALRCRMRALLHAATAPARATPPPAPAHKSIMEFFDIKGDEHLLKHRPEPAMEATAEVAPVDEPPPAPPRQSCLVSVLLHEPHVFVTLETLETLVSIGDAWTSFLQEHIPELFDVPASVVLDYEATRSAPGAPAPPQPTPSLLELLEDKKRGVRISSTNDTRADATAEEPGGFQELFAITFVDVQVFLQDTLHKGAVLLALPSGTVNHAVDLDANTERVHVDLRGVFMYTSALDVDVMHRPWLKRNAADSYCDRSSALLRKVLQAPDTQRCRIAVTHAVPPVHQIDVTIPCVDATLDADSMHILFDLGTAFAHAAQDKMAKTKHAAAMEAMLRHLTPSSALASLSLPELWRRQRRARWDLRQLRWQQACRDGCGLAREAESTRRPRLSARSASHSGEPDDAASRALEQLEAEVDAVRAAMAQSYAQFRLARQVRPTVELGFQLARATLLLQSPSVAILQVVHEGLALSLTQFEDQSGALSCTVAGLSATNLLPQTPYPELLGRAAAAMDGHIVDSIVRIDAEMAAPVGGITVLQHFEVNVQPLQVCLTHDLLTHVAQLLGGDRGRHDDAAAEVRSQFLDLGQARKPRKSVAEWGEDAVQEAAEMTDRAAKNMTFRHIRLGTVHVLVSYKRGKAATVQHLEDMRGFDLKLHALVYADKTCTLAELLQRIRRDIILDVLSQVGRNFNNIGLLLKEKFDLSRWTMEFPVRTTSQPVAPVVDRPFQLELPHDGDTTPKKGKTRFSFLKPKKTKTKEEVVSNASPSNSADIRAT